VSEIVITRVLDAPPDAVFRAWTDPEEVAAWYGPEQFSAERVRIDLRVGGRWELVMVRRDGAGEFPVGYEIVELVAPELLVLRSGDIVTRVELAAAGRGTRLTLTDGPYPSGGEHAEAGWTAALDKLAARLR
jgi:hypothetical protein